MTNYREILRLHSRGISQRGIAASCQCSRNTVKNVLERAKETSLGWPLKSDRTDGDLERLLFPDSAPPLSLPCFLKGYPHPPCPLQGVYHTP